MKAVEIISIPVSDQEKSKQFYVNQVGFNLMFESNTPDGRKWIQVGLPDDKLTFTIVSGEAHPAPGSVKGTVILTDDIKSDVERLHANGVETESIRTFPHGKITSFKDPDGNQWVLREPVQA